MRNKVLADASRPLSKELFNIGDTLNFTKDGSYETVELLEIDINFETMVPYLKIRLQNGLETKVTKEYLSPKDTEILFQLPITTPQIREHATFLDSDTLQAMLHPQSYPPWYPECILNHDRLRNLPFIEMFKLVDRGRLPKKFLELKGKNDRLSFVCFRKSKAQSMAWPW